MIPSATKQLRQTPTEGETFLDHVGFFVSDLEVAGVQLEALGFRVSPVNVQKARVGDGSLRPVGTSNRNVILSSGFIELLSPTSQSELSARMTTAIRRNEGAHLIAFSQSDLEATRARLVDSGWRMEDVVKLRRRDPDVAWDVLRCDPSEMPEGRIQFAVCLTPDTVWSGLTPPNGLAMLSSILVVVDDPTEAAERFAEYVGRRQPPSGTDGLTVLELDRGRLCFVEPTTARSAGITVHAVPQIVGIGLGMDGPDDADPRLPVDQVRVESFGTCLRIDLGPPLNAVIAIDTPSADPWPAILGFDPDDRGA